MAKKKDVNDHDEEEGEEEVVVESTSIWDKMKKASSDMAERTMASSKNTKESISIQKKQQQIMTIKKSFGIQYIDMLMDENNDTTPEMLQELVDKTVKEITTLQEKQKKYQTRINQNNEQLEEKLNSPIK